MMNSRAYIAALLFAAVPAIGFAQTFNPKVVITNAYDGKVMEVQKQEMEMAVPDSLQHFDLAFDYSVFDNPYTGSYEFSPYEMCFTPQASPYQSSKLFLRGGAGYSLHPELQAVYTPVFKGSMGLSLYDDFKGYAGQYRNLEAQGDESLWTIGENKADPYTGYDFTNRFGVRGLNRGKKADFGFDASYGLLASMDTIVSHFANSADLKLDLASNYDPADGIYSYDASLDLQYFHDSFCGTGYGQYGADFKASFFAMLGDKSRLVLDFGEQIVKHNGALASLAGVTSLTPKFVWSNKRAYLSAGVSAMVNMKGTRDEQTRNLMYGQAAQLITPQFDFSFRLVPDYLAFKAYVKGGSTINTYSSILSTHHMIDPVGCRDLGQFLDYSVTKLDAGAGFNGCIAGKLQYDLLAGWGSYDNAMVDAIEAFDIPQPNTLRAYIAYADYTALYAEANLRWKSAKFEADGYFRYQNTDRTHLIGVVQPASYRGLLNAKYIFSERISFGLTGEYMSARKQECFMNLTSGTYVVPAFVDLGAFADYRLTSKLSFWLKGSNLLCQNIQRTVLYAEKGIAVTAGACLNF